MRPEKRLFLLAVMLIAATTCTFGKVTITVKNPTALPRQVGEMVEVVLPQPDGAVIIDEGGGIIPSQLTYDGKTIFPRPAMGAKETLRFYALSKEEYAALHPDKPAVSYERKVFGRLYPERQEDFSFENDRLAYRLYGPDTQRRGERLYGYDLFNKRTSAMVLDELYAGQCDSQMWNTISKLNKAGKRDLGDDVYYAIGSYHVDHGKGMDCYKVGPTLGAGTCALMDKEEIIYPWCFATAEVLDNGPLRLTVRLTYSAIEIRGKKVTETRVLTVDAGSSMVKATVAYDGLNTKEDNALRWGAGIAIHKEAPTDYVSQSGEGYSFIAYADRGDSELYIKRFRETLNKEMGQCFIACMIPEKGCRTAFQPFDKEVASATGHLIVSKPMSSSLLYYFGNAWSRNAAVGISNLDEWQAYLKEFSRQVCKPLSVKVR